MNQKMKRLLVSYGAAAVFITAGLIFTSAAGVEGYRISQDNEYRRAMAQLVSSISDADEALRKGSVTTGAGMSGRVSAQLMAATQSASTALSILPLDTYALEEVAAFLSQLEEYADVKGSLACEGTGFDDADRQLFLQLQQVTGQMVPVLGEMYRYLSEGAMSIRGRIAENGLVTDEADTYLEDELLKLLEEFPETPQLNYAGTLSDDRESGYSAVKGLETVAEEQAQTVAEALCDGATLSVMGLSRGELPSYYFSGKTEKGAVTVAVTER
ncbi:MAG: germination protein YpeB, partial [Oscillospiraceae bacterium]|nr:germination protein YpeB [Oscillospiraceae bacterium]